MSAAPMTRAYVVDMLEMYESAQVPGNGHFVPSPGDGERIARILLHYMDDNVRLREDRDLWRAAEDSCSEQHDKRVSEIGKLKFDANAARGEVERLRALRRRADRWMPPLGCPDCISSVLCPRHERAAVAADKKGGDDE